MEAGTRFLLFHLATPHSPRWLNLNSPGFADAPPSNLLAIPRELSFSTTDFDLCLFSGECLLMDGRRKLLDWAKGEGVSLHGVYPAKTTCRGTGMAASRRLEV